MKILDIEVSEFFAQHGPKYNVLAVLIRPDGSRKFIPGSNIVTVKGNKWYAARGALAASGFLISFMRLGIGSTAVTNADTDVTTSFTSCYGYLDTGYPQLSDTDTDNTSAVSNAVCWRVTYSANNVSQVGIRELVLCDTSTGAPTNILNHALFAAAFDKTYADTLKVFVNHTFTGV